MSPPNRELTPQATEQRRQLLISGDEGDNLVVTEASIGSWTNQGTLTFDGSSSSFAAGSYNVWNRDGCLEQLIVDTDITTTGLV